MEEAFQQDLNTRYKMPSINEASDYDGPFKHKKAILSTLYVLNNLRSFFCDFFQKKADYIKLISFLFLFTLFSVFTIGGNFFAKERLESKNR